MVTDWPHPSIIWMKRVSLPRRNLCHVMHQSFKINGTACLSPAVAVCRFASLKIRMFANTQYRYINELTRFPNDLYFLLILFISIDNRPCWTLPGPFSSVSIGAHWHGKEAVDLSVQLDVFQCLNIWLYKQFWYMINLASSSFHLDPPNMACFHRICQHWVPDNSAIFALHVTGNDC